MKKSVILAALGLAVATVSSYAQQGFIAFDTYDAAGGAGIQTVFGNGPSVGSGIGSTFTGELLFSTTAINDSATTAGTASNPLTGGWTVASTGTFNTGAASAGYITGPNFTYASGGTFFFEIAAFNGASYGASTYQGHSASFQATLVTGTTLPNADQLDNLAPFSVFQTVPEPTTMALGGLGLAALLVARRKKA
jgi:hypothetical protein